MSHEKGKRDKARYTGDITGSMEGALLLLATQETNVDLCAFAQCAFARIQLYTISVLMAGSERTAGQ